MTYTPTSSILINGSWRQSHTLSTGSSFCSACSSTTGAGSESWQKIGTIDASWVVNARSFASFEYTHYENPTQSRADNESAAVPTLTTGTKLDIAGLDKLGAFNVPTPVAGQDAFNAFIQPLINQYGYTSSGVKTGGGTVGTRPR